MNKYINRMLIIVIVLAMSLSALTMQAFATEITLIDGGIKIVDTANKLEKQGTNGAKATASGSLFSKASNTITLSNELSETVKLSLNYSVSNANSFTLNGASAETNGSINQDLAPGDSIAFYIQSKSGLSGTTVTLSLSEISVATIAASAEVTFNYDSSIGSVTANGAALSSGTTLTVTSAGTALVATPKSGVIFLGWVNAADGKLLSKDASYNMTPTENMAVAPMFASASADAWFLAGGSYYYNDLNQAATKAAETDKRVIPVHDGVLPSGDYTIPTGVTLLIPYNANNTLCTTKPTITADAWVKPTAYRTLTMESGAHLTVNGAISVSGTQTRAIVKETNGAPTGPLGFIKMNDNSSITVSNGGSLYAWGYIHGTGAVTIKSGGTVYESFQLADYRAGDVTTQMTAGDNLSTYHVFPFSQYYAQNVQVPMRLEAGAIENTYMSVTVSSIELSTQVDFIGPTGMFQITDGYIIKDYDEASDRLHLTVEGGFQIIPTTITIDSGLAGFIGVEDVEIISENYYLPIHAGLTIDVASGTLTISQDIVLHPGAEINIAEEANVVVDNNKSVVVYDSADWAKTATTINNVAYAGTGFCYTEANGYKNYQLVPVKYAVDRQKTRARTNSDDAKICVGGTLDISNGYLYTTAGGANICGEENGSVITRAGTATANYQVWQYDTTISYQSISMTAAKLQNANATYVQSSTNTYTYFEGFWHNSSCTEKWKNNAKCACGHDAVAAIVTDTNGTIKQDYHGTLAATVDSYESGTGYIQMLTGTTETTVGDTENTKDIYLDLNGQKVEVTAFNVGTLYGMDTATNAFSSTNAGSITGSITGVVADHYHYDLGGVKGKYYAASINGNEYSFHRFDLGVQKYTYYTNGTLAFDLLIKGDEEAIKELVKCGVYIWDDSNDQYNWRDAVEQTYSGYMELTDDQFANVFNVQAAVMMNDTAQTPIVGDKYFADKISLQTLLNGGAG